MARDARMRGIYLPHETVAKVDTLARMAGVSRSRLIRELIERTTVARPLALELRLAGEGEMA